MSLELKFILMVGLSQFVLCAESPSQSLETSHATRLSVMGGTFIYHLYRPDFNDPTEFFENKYISVNYELKNGNELYFGTALTSGGERVAVIGYKKNWARLNERLSFEGMYGYGGNFFFPFLSESGGGGFYGEMKNLTGVAFAPYIYHAFEFRLSRSASIHSGIFLPLTFCTTFQVHI